MSAEVRAVVDMTGSTSLRVVVDADAWASLKAAGAGPGAHIQARFVADDGRYTKSVDAEVTGVQHHGRSVRVRISRAAPHSDVGFIGCGGCETVYLSLG